MRKFVQNLKQKASAAAHDHAAHQTPIKKPDGEHNAASLARWTFDYFYSAQNGQFQARVKSESTLGENDHFGYVVWPVTIMVQAVAETLTDKHIINTAVSCLQAYWNPERHGFCAWKMFPGNEDIYYDDNGHACQALISAFQATGEQKYLDQAKEILTHLIMPAAEKDGGVPWHTNNQNCRNSCSTGPAAVAALRIYNIQKDQKLLTFAERALYWMLTEMRDPRDGLIWDSFVIEEDGKLKMNQMKWTYNTGFAIHGFALLYENTQKKEHLDLAINFAHAASNPGGSLFDHTIPDPDSRMYSDGSFFLHHLVDGYRALAPYASQEQLSEKITRIAQWGREWMFDSTDGLYFRGSCPYTISEDLESRYNKRFGVQRGFEPNGQELDEQSKLCKTLIGNAGWIRILKAAEG